MNLVWGAAGQMRFQNEAEYYKVLGMFSNNEIVSISYEDNAKRGSFSDAYRIHIKKAAHTIKFPDSIGLKSSYRINNNPYVLNLLENHGFIQSGNTIMSSLQNVVATVPCEYIGVFFEGYNMLSSGSGEHVKMTPYETPCIDVSRTVLINRKVPEKQKNKSNVRPNKKNEKIGKKDYIKTAIENFEIGEAGEQLVYLEERKKLIKAYESGKIFDLKDKLEWVSRTDDSLGYDIRSFDVETGESLYIEVKTTRGDSRTSFYMSNNEIEASKRLNKYYRIYRVYGMKSNKPDVAEYFVLEGDISANENVVIVSSDSRVDIL